MVDALCSCYYRLLRSYSSCCRKIQTHPCLSADDLFISQPQSKVPFRFIFWSVTLENLVLISCYSLAFKSFLKGDEKIGVIDRESKMQVLGADDNRRIGNVALEERMHLRNGSFALTFLVKEGQSNFYPTPPLPVGPIPTASQLAFQERELAMFFHFGMNTFTDSEWGDGKADPILFNPPNLDTNQWVSVAKAAGFKTVILTVKHHDGFCLWQTKYTNYSVATSQWKSGTGDVLEELVTSASQAGLKVGVYLSPWDRHDESYGSTLGYNEHYLAQIRELLTLYGPISEVWLDGAKGDTVEMNYFFQDWFDVIKQLQPAANIFSDSGPDVRWVGDESGSAGSTCWAMMNRSKVTIGEGGEALDYLNTGDQYGTNWVPPECDVSIRQNWFWHAGDEPSTLQSLLEIYFSSVGRNCVLLLNVPPNSTGLISEADIERLQQLRVAIDRIFSVNLVRGALATASSTRGESSVGPGNSPFEPSNVLDECLDTFWTPEGVIQSYLELELKSVSVFNVLKIQEVVSLGQRVSQYSLFAWTADSWQMVSNGTTIGFKRLDRFPLCRQTSFALR